MTTNCRTMRPAAELPDSELVTVRVSVVAVRARSALLAMGGRARIQRWIPRSMIVPDDAARLDAAMAGHAMTLRMSKEKALEVGFETGRDDAAAAGDLFGPSGDGPT